KYCFVVRRRGKIFILCKQNPRHKQRQGMHTSCLATADCSSSGGAGG
ncbi:unnamed protein product, partial [Phaeothamnion confervicola]